MKKNNRLYFWGIIVLLILGIALCAGLVISRITLGGFLRGIPNESDREPAYVEYGVLHIGDKSVRVSQLCEQQDEQNNWIETFCVVSGVVYFVYTRDSNVYDWCLASIELETLTFRDHCRFVDAQELYRPNLYDEYDVRNGFFSDGQIILTDHVSVLVFDIERNEASMYNYDTFVFPERFAYGDCPEKNKLTLWINDSHDTFSFEEMAQKSDGIAKLYSIRDKEIWNNASAFASFLSRNRVQSVGDRIYTIEDIMDYWGMPYMVIFEYDREENKWCYISSCFVGADTYGKCYIIPEI